MQELEDINTADRVDSVAVAVAVEVVGLAVAEDTQVTPVSVAATLVTLVSAGPVDLPKLMAHPVATLSAEVLSVDSRLIDNRSLATAAGTRTVVPEDTKEEAKEDMDTVDVTLKG